MILTKKIFDVQEYHRDSISDITLWTYAKYGQKVLFHECAKSAYFCSASSVSDNK